MCFTAIMTVSVALLRAFLRLSSNPSSYTFTPAFSTQSSLKKKISRWTPDSLDSSVKSSRLHHFISIEAGGKISLWKSPRGESWTVYFTDWFPMKHTFSNLNSPSSSSPCEFSMRLSWRAGGGGMCEIKSGKKSKEKSVWQRHRKKRNIFRAQEKQAI